MLKTGRTIFILTVYLFFSCFYFQIGTCHFGFFQFLVSTICFRIVFTCHIVQFFFSVFGSDRLFQKKIFSNSYLSLCYILFNVWFRSIILLYFYMIWFVHAILILATLRTNIMFLSFFKYIP